MPKTDNLSEYLPTKLGLPELVKQANGGDQAALAELRKTLDENPQIWRAVGNLALHARMVLAKAIANDNQFMMDALLRHAHEMEVELAGPSPSPLERLAVQRIVACWLETHYAALQGPEPAGSTLKHARFALQVRESAEKRFHAAIKSYSLVRQLLGTGGKAAGRRQPNTPAVPDAAANGNGQVHEDASHTTAPASGNDQASHTPANRISKHLAEKPNGQVNRLRVYAEDAAPEEKHEVPLT